MLWGAAYGLFGAVFALLIGALRIAIALAKGRHIRFDDLHILGFYIGGFIAAGAIIGVLWPFTRTRSGRYGVSIFGASIFVSSFTVGIFGRPTLWEGAVIFSWAVSSMLFGAMLAKQLKQQENL
jgi:hypothetical protein